MQTYVLVNAILNKNVLTCFFNVSKLVSDINSTSNLFHSTGAA